MVEASVAPKHPTNSATTRRNARAQRSATSIGFAARNVVNPILENGGRSPTRSTSIDVMRWCVLFGRSHAQLDLLGITNGSIASNRLRNSSCRVGLWKEIAAAKEVVQVAVRCAPVGRLRRGTTRYITKDKFCDAIKSIIKVSANTDCLSATCEATASRYLRQPARSGLGLSQHE